MPHWSYLLWQLADNKQWPGICWSLSLLIAVAAMRLSKYKRHPESGRNRWCSALFREGSLIANTYPKISSNFFSSSSFNLLSYFSFSTNFILKFWIYENHIIMWTADWRIKWTIIILQFFTPQFTYMIFIYSNLHHHPFTDLWTNQFNDLLPVGLIGRALHRYRIGQGFESRTSLNIFQAFFSQLQKMRI